ncbi:MAG: sulfatase [Myxococcota bacterium]
MRLLLALWALCAALAAAAAGGHDARVALGHEVWLGPLAIAGAHLPLVLLSGLVRRRWIALLPVALGGFWAATIRLPEGRGPVAEGPPVVLLTLDTFRADRVGEATTPSLTAFATRATTFTQAVTLAPLTGPAHATMLTGLPVAEHGLLENGRRVQADTVVPRLRDAGLRTGAFLGAHVLDAHTGLDAGFDHYDDRWGVGQRLLWIPGLAALDPPKRGVQRRGDETVERALRWLADSPGRVFLWVHLYDAHAPYGAPTLWRPDAESLAAARAADVEERGEPTIFELLERPSPRVQTLQYDAGVRYADHLAGRLLDALPDDAVVIVVGDHGESLADHDLWFDHGARLWEEVLRVPMMVRWPGRWEGGARDDLVGVDAIADLLLQAAGLAPIADLPARDEVLAYTTGQRSRGSLVRRPKGPRRGGACARLAGGKLVSHDGEDVVWYDLAADPGETSPEGVPPALDAAAARVREAVAAPLPETDAALRQRLRALGYEE